MGPEPVVVDISSDEEDAAFDGSGGNSFDYQSSLEWLSKMLELDDEPWVSKVVVDVDELSCTAQLQNLSSAKSNVAKHVSVDDSDDDCKVLDGDPDKPVEATQSEGNGSDELLIVGEKGQLACRDFPHSRHLCATFPFSTTSHEKFCKLCHCYVCDIPAPCIYWGTGSSTDDHCHSSDKEEKWRVKRKASRCASSAAEHSESLPVATPSIRPPGVRLPSMRMPGMGTSCSIRRCSATSFGTPNIISQRRSHPSIVHSNHRYNQQFNRSQNFSGADSIQKDPRGLSPQIFSAHTHVRMPFAGFVNVTAKRPRMTNTIHTHFYSRKQQRSSCLPAPLVDENVKEWHDVLLGRDPDSETNFQQCVVYPQPEMDGQSYTHTSPNAGMNLLGSSAPATISPNFLNDRWLNTASMNATADVTLANSPLPNVQFKNRYAVPESNPVSGEVPLGERIGSACQEPLQEAAGEQGVKELNPCTYDELEMLNSFLYV